MIGCNATIPFRACPVAAVKKEIHLLSNAMLRPKCRKLAPGSAKPAI